MGMRQATTFITPCELIREINDLVQGSHPKEITIRNKLIKLENMSKLMANKIFKHDKIWRNKAWREKNIDEREDWKRRIDMNNYKTGRL